MAYVFDSLSQVFDAPFDAVIDTRSPAEFAEDHIPDALSMPVLSDAERARVGTVYKQHSPFAARKIGAALVARNSAAHIETHLAPHPGGWRPLVYCWRGGQRSNAFAAILQQIGWRAQVVEGGYRSYRRLVVRMLHDAALPHRLVVLDGNTGSGKTEILDLLARRGVQVLDLEAMANHRGSLFGAVGQQPAQKAFETRIARALCALDPARPTVVEAESSKVGDLILPPALWKAMTIAPRIAIQATAEARAAYLLRSYPDFAADLDRFCGLLRLMIPYHGHDLVASWVAMARARQGQRLALQLITHHYDPRYHRSRRAHAPQVLAQVTAQELGASDLDAIAAQINLVLTRMAAPA